MKLIDKLFAGPIDIVGDVHGEIEPLNALLGRLGYSEDGSHPEGRRLVFAGDLVDRGPDSPAVLRKVMGFVADGHAQCVLGNHELALLRNDSKPANGWWFDNKASTGREQTLIDPAEKPHVLKFLGSLPLALEREDLRVVHACWNDIAIDELRYRMNDADSVAELYEEYDAKFAKRWSSGALADALARDCALFDLDETNDKVKSAPYFGTKARYEREKQMANPVAVVTSGEETETDRPFWAGGKWRMVERVAWWDRYHDELPVIVGHYWRNLTDVRPAASDKHGKDLFEDIEPHAWFGARNNVYCVDFSIGMLGRQVAEEKPPEHCSLAAVRVPKNAVEEGTKWAVIHDRAKSADLDPPGSQAEA